MLKLKEGRLLISEPSLNDSIFFKSVILLTHHNDEESIGLILNHPTKIRLHQILNDIPLIDFPVYLGGPVGKQSLHFIHTLGNLIPNSKNIINNIYYGGDFEIVTKLIYEKRITKEQIRFFIGYSGWGIEQLNNEIKEDSWIIENSTPDLCMSYSTSVLWSDIIRSQTDKYAIWANMPRNPNLN